MSESNTRDVEIRTIELPLEKVLHLCPDLAEYAQVPGVKAKISAVVSFTGKRIPTRVYRELLDNLLASTSERRYTFKNDLYVFDFFKHEHRAFGEPVHLTALEEYTLMLWCINGERTHAFDRALLNMRQRLGKNFLKGVVR